MFQHWPDCHTKCGEKKVWKCSFELVLLHAVNMVSWAVLKPKQHSNLHSTSFNIHIAFQPCDYNYIRKQCMIDFWLHSSSNTLRWCEHNPKKVCKGINGLSLSTHQGLMLRPVGSPMRPAFTQCTLKLPWLLWVQMTE